MSIFDDDDKLFFENENWAFYTNSITKMLTKDAREMDINGVELRGWFVLLGVCKYEDKRMFVLFDDDGMPVRDSHSLEDMSYKIEFIKMAKREENDIVYMAERTGRLKAGDGSAER